MLFFMQLSKKIPFDDPNVLLGVRILYVSSNVIIAGIYFYIQQKINQKKGTFCRHATAWISPLQGGHYFRIAC